MERFKKNAWNEHLLLFHLVLYRNRFLNEQNQIVLILAYTYSERLLSISFVSWLRLAFDFENFDEEENPIFNINSI